MHVARLVAPRASRVGGRLPWERALVAAALALSGVLPEGPAWLLALSAVILLGVPHEALNAEIARPHLRPRCGRAWFAVFAAPYLALAADPVRAPRVWNGRTAILRSLPITVLTLLIGAALWPLYAGPAPERLLALTLQGVAALTLPQMLLDGLAGRAERSRG